MNLPVWLDPLRAVLGFLSSLIAAVLAFLAWRKAWVIRRQQVEDEHRRKEPIGLILVNEVDGREHVLGYRPRRDQATRSELLGILGMYSGEARFESSKLVPILESGAFDRMIAGQTNELRFPVATADFERFVKRDRELQPARPPPAAGHRATRLLAGVKHEIGTL
jgi:hypothetical protein